MARETSENGHNKQKWPTTRTTTTKGALNKLSFWSWNGCLFSAHTRDELTINKHFHNYCRWFGMSCYYTLCSVQQSVSALATYILQSTISFPCAPLDYLLRLYVCTIFIKYFLSSHFSLLSVYYSFYFMLVLTLFFAAAFFKCDILSSVTTAI